MTTEQNCVFTAITEPADRLTFGKKDLRDFASRHADQQAFAWILSMKEKSQPCGENLAS